MSHIAIKGHPRPANANCPNRLQGEAAINLAGELLLDIEKEAAARGVPADLVRESLFFTFIPSLMDASYHEWSADDLADAVRRAAESWTDLRGRDRCIAPLR